MHVVIVDPSRVVHAKIRAELEAVGAYVDAFFSADIAYKYIADTLTVDVVITSLELEPMSGLELCWALRTLSGETRPLHIIVMSSNQSERALPEALDSGADDFISKPVGREELRARLRAAERIMKLQRDLIDLARIDQCTGSLNRRAFLEDAVLRRKDLDPTDRMTVCLCDVDHFKHIDETYGHDVSDMVLKTIAGFAAEEAPLVARYGAEEFALGFPILDPDEAAHWCEMIRKRIAEHTFETENGAFKVTCSFGVSEWMADEALDKAMHNAEHALKLAKKLGRNQIKVFEHAPVAEAV